MTTPAFGFADANARAWQMADDGIDPTLPPVVPMVAYQQHPERFLVEQLGIAANTIRWDMNAGYENHVWDGTRNPLVAMLEAVRDSMDVCIEAGTGTQKSFTAAALMLWFIACWKEARAFTFAPKEEQLRSYIWMEIGKLWPKFQILFPSAILTDLRIQMRGRNDKAWGAMGVSVGIKAGEQVSTKAQGMHAADMLLIYEEAPGIEMAVMEAGENTATAPHNIRIALGNPDSQLDALHQFGYDNAGRVRVGVCAIRISALDHPNVVTANPAVVPGAASIKSVERRRNKYGAESRLFESRIRGISPSEAATALIKLDWVKAAQARWADPSARRILEAVGLGRRSLGVDVANSENGDEAAIARGLGAVLLEVDSFPCPDANNLGFQVHLEMIEKGIEADLVGVDVVGVGAGTVNELRHRNHYIRALGGGGAAIGSMDDEDWNNLRSQIHWTLREDLRNNLIALPPDLELSQDLITPTWKTNSGKIVVESKELLMKRLPGGRSPNKGDAVAYWNFVRPRDPVLTEMPKRAPTMRERVMLDVQSLAPPKKKVKSYHVMRQ